MTRGYTKLLRGGLRWYLADEVDVRAQALEDYIEKLKVKSKAGLYTTSNASICRELRRIMEAEG